MSRTYPNLYDMLDEYKLEQLEEMGRIKANYDSDHELFIWNYTNKAQFANEWTEEERVCRGVITNINGDIIARGMPKFFNEGDPRVGDVALDEPLRLFEKMDGSLGITFLDEDGDVCVATRGSFTSDQARMAQHIMDRKEYAGLRDLVRYEAEHGRTVLVEIIYPENKIVVDYGDDAKLVWLGSVNNATGRWVPNNNLLVDETTLGDGVPVVAHNKEGYVAVTTDGTMFKIKGEEYKRLHKLIFGLSNKTVWELLTAPEGYKKFVEFRNQVPAPIGVWLDREYKKLQIQQGKLYQQVLAAYNDVCGDEEYIERRWIGQRLQEKYPELLSLVFTLIDKDGTALVKQINKAIKPKNYRPYAVEPKED